MFPNNVTISLVKYLLIRDGSKVGVWFSLYHLKPVPSLKLTVKYKCVPNLTKNHYFLISEIILGGLFIFSIFLLQMCTEFSASYKILKYVIVRNFSDRLMGLSLSTEFHVGTSYWMILRAACCFSFSPTSCSWSLDWCADLPTSLFCSCVMF